MRRRTALATLGAAVTSGCSGFVRWYTDVPSPTPTATPPQNEFVPERYEPDGWPGYRGGATRSGVVAGGSVPASDEPTVRWRRDIDGAAARVTMARGLTYVIRGGGAMDVLAQDGGETVGRFTKFGQHNDRETIAVVGGRIFYPITRGGLYAMDARTGQRQWRLGVDPHPRDSKPRIGRSAPTADGERVYAIVFPARDEPGRIVAFDAATGERRWRTDPGRLRPREVPFALADGTLYARVRAAVDGGYEPAIVGLDPATGTVRSRISTPRSGPVSAIAAAGDRIVVPYADGVLVGVDPDDGVAWRYDADPAVDTEEWRPPVAPVGTNGETVFVGTADGVFHAVDAATGEQRWTHSVGEKGYWTPSVVGDDHVYVARGAMVGGRYVKRHRIDGGEQLALRAGSGELVWSRPTDGMPLPPVGGDRIVAFPRRVYGNQTVIEAIR